MRIITRFGIAVAGLTTMAIAVVWGIVDVDENVPNDANIGAGLLFMVGVALLFVGLIVVWTRRPEAANSPPPPSAN